MNGWTNDETWLASLWIQNDEALYHQARIAAQRGKLQELITDVLLEATKTAFAVDILSRSINRINWQELNEIFE